MKKVNLFLSGISLKSLIILGSLFPQFCIGQDITGPDIKEVVITATKTEQSPDSVGRSVTLITKKQIEEGQFQTLGEILSSQSGISIIGANMNPGMPNSLFLRGTGSNHTVVMIDGVRITDPSSVNNAGDLSEISLAGIDRIEILKGTSSSLHGSSAIGGVINLITDHSVKNTGLYLDALLQTGVFGESTSDLHTNVGIGYKLKNGFYADVRFNQVISHGIDATIDTITNTNIYNVRDQDDLDHRDFGSGAGYTGKKFNAAINFKKTVREIDLDKRAFTDDDNYELSFDRNLFTFGSSYKGTNWNIRLNGGYTSMNREATDDSSVVDNLGTFDQTFVKDNYEGSNLYQELQFEYQKKYWNLIAGGVYDKETMSARNYIYSDSQFGLYESLTDLDSLKLNSNTTAIFGRADMNAEAISKNLKGLKLALGGRFSQHSVFGENFTFEINPSLAVGEGSFLFANIASGYNAPSLYQMYAPETYYTSNITRGNSDLKPETSLNFEFGFRKIGDNTKINVSVYKTEINNTIEYVYLWDKDISIDDLGNDWMRDDYRGDAYINAGTTMIHGIDASITNALSTKLRSEIAISLVEGNTEYKASEKNSSHTQDNHVQLFSNGSFLNKDIQVQGLSRRPSSGRISLMYAANTRLNLRTDLRMTGSRNDIYYDSNLGPFGALAQSAVTSYTLLDISGRYKFNNHLYAGIKIGNVTDETYSEIRGFSTIGRSIHVSLKYSLSNI